MPKGSGQVWAKGYMFTAAWGRREGGSSAGSSVFRRRRDAEGCFRRMRRGVRMQTPGGVVTMSWRGRDADFRRERQHPRVHGAQKRCSGRRGARVAAGGTKRESSCIGSWQHMGRRYLRVHFVFVRWQTTSHTPCELAHGLSLVVLRLGSRYCSTACCLVLCGSRVSTTVRFRVCVPSTPAPR